MSSNMRFMIAMPAHGVISLSENRREKSIQSPHRNRDTERQPKITLNTIKINYLR